MKIFIDLLFLEPGPNWERVLVGRLALQPLLSGALPFFCKVKIMYEIFLLHYYFDFGQLCDYLTPTPLSAVLCSTAVLCAREHHVMVT